VPINRIGVTLVAAAAAGALAVGGAALANAATVTGTPVAAAVSNNTGHPWGGGWSGGTPVTGDELAKVTAAVQAKDPAFTVITVRKDPAGSYHVFGTTSGTPAGYQVSADLQTITANTGHGGGWGWSGDTPVTGDELAKVTAAVQAKDPSFTVIGVRKDADGSYDVFGTTSGTPAGYQVSADLQTITQRTGHR
jgi:hypothetical protein